MVEDGGVMLPERPEEELMLVTKPVLVALPQALEATAVMVTAPGVVPNWMVGAEVVPPAVMAASPEMTHA